MSINILCWNVAGVRARLTKKDLDFLLLQDNSEIYDIVCIQETKARPEQVKLSDEFKKLYPYRYWQSNKGTTQQIGFSGTCIWSKIEPMREIEPPLFDEEGRVTAIEFQKFNLVTVYTPNSQDAYSDRCKYRIDKWDPQFRQYIRDLNREKPVIVCGDFNVAYHDIDIYNSKKYYNAVAGFLNSEREEFAKHLSLGFVDALREKNQSRELYTYWNQRVPKMRLTNRGWRIDYFLVEDRLKENIEECKIHDQIKGSDHCPISLKIRD